MLAYETKPYEIKKTPFVVNIYYIPVNAPKANIFNNVYNYVNFCQ